MKRERGDSKCKGIWQLTESESEIESRLRESKRESYLIYRLDFGKRIYKSTSFK